MRAPVAGGALALYGRPAKQATACSGVVAGLGVVGVYGGEDGLELLGAPVAVVGTHRATR